MANYIEIEVRDWFLTFGYLIMIITGGLSLFTVLLFLEPVGIKIPFGLASMICSVAIGFMGFIGLFSNKSLYKKKVIIKKEIDK